MTEKPKHHAEPREPSSANQGGGENEAHTGSADVDQVFAGATSHLDQDESESPPSDAVAQLQSQLREAEQRVLRAQADLENFRKRTRREMEDLQRYAIIPLVRDILPAIDNLQRASASVRSDEPAEHLLEGVKMVTQQLVSVLEQHHCRPIEAAGQEFDPTWHEAISELPSDEHPPGTVMEVPQIGYRVLDRVVRPAQVVVARANS